LDPLAQLKDIQLPEQINNYPVAPGWWLLLALVITLLIWAVIALLKYRKIRKDKNSALAHLDFLKKNDNENCADYIAIIKWAALQYFPRVEVASLYGKQFQQFLLSVLPEKQQAQFKQLPLDIFDNIYKEFNNSEHLSDLQQATYHWLSHALPPIEKPPMEETEAESSQAKKATVEKTELAHD